MGCTCAKEAAGNNGTNGAPAFGHGVRHESSDQGDEDSILVIRVMRAELVRDFDGFGKMDPYAIVKWVGNSGEEWELSRTRTDWNGHFEPNWDHTCRGKRYPGHGKGEVKIEVWEDNLLDTPCFCGSARIKVDDLLGERVLKATPAGEDLGNVVLGQLHDFVLLNENETVGSIHLQGLLTPASGRRNSTETATTKMDSKLFDSPVARLDVAGGTAPFFRLMLKETSPHKAATYYIGKDLSRASDEVVFYEEALQLRQKKGGGGLVPLLDFMFEYGGVTSISANDASATEPPKELLVLRNLFDGVEVLRLLDIKIGQKTSQAGWHGKSRMAAFRQSVLDGITNSTAEGFRLEGFSRRPPALTSMDPLLDFALSDTRGVLGKKARKFMLQQLSGSEMLMHFADLHQEPGLPSRTSWEQVLSPSELTEVMLHEAVIRLARLAVTCRRVPVPQKWIGSSIAIGFDVGKLPPRSTSEEDLRRTLRFNTFDWGRSELNTVEKHMALSETDREDRAKFWRFYVGGVDRLSWRAACQYYNRFCNAGDWSEVTFRLHDFDSTTENDFLGFHTVPLQEALQEGTTGQTSSTPPKEVTVQIKAGALLTYAIEWRKFPSGSRLRGAWLIHLVRARSLGMADKMQLRTTSDPVCEVVGVSDSSPLKVFRQFSSVKARTLEPEWNETFELPVAAKENAFNESLEAIAPGFGVHPLTEVLPAEIRDPEEAACMGPCESSSIDIPAARFLQERGLEAWRSRLDDAATECI